jgi:cytochrome c-type biogenesis protein CcmH
VLVVLAVVLAISALWRQSRGLALAIAIGLPLVAASLYYLEGQPEGLDPKVAAAPETMEAAVAQLEQRLAAQPENYEGTVLLARSYMAMARFADAKTAYARALALKPGETDLTVELAEAMLRAAPDRRFPPEAVALLEKAVAANPQNQRALFFLGLERMQVEKFAEASATWEKLLPMLDPAAGQELLKQINQARAEAGMPLLPTSAVAASQSSATDQGGLALAVQMDPELAKSVPPGAVLFVFARATDGQGPPFAAKRIEGAQFPLPLRLSDADSLMPTAKLSSQTRVLLMARLSASGDAKPGPGDIESRPVEVEVAATKSTVLLLDHRLP